MKIVHVIFTMQIGGAETMLVDILNEQAKTSNDVRIVIINDDYNPALLKKIDSRVVITKMERRDNVSSLWVGMKFNLLMLKEKPDVIHFHDHKAINILFNRKKYNTILTLHNVGLESDNWHKYSLMAAISKAVQKEILDRTGIRAELIYNGIDLSAIRKKTTVTRNYKIVQVGRLAMEKNGQDILLRALDVLQKKYEDCPISLDVIGEGYSLPSLTNLSQALGVERVSFLGSKDRAYIYNELANYDLLVQPSRYEGFGLVIAEALAANIQVLVSDTDAAMEVIGDGKYGFSFKIGDHEDCARQLEKILIKGESVDLNNVNEYLLQNFDIQKTALKYVDLYKRLIEK